MQQYNDKMNWNKLIARVNALRNEQYKRENNQVYIKYYHSIEWKPLGNITKKKFCDDIYYVNSMME